MTKSIGDVWEAVLDCLKKEAVDHAFFHACDKLARDFPPDHPGATVVLGGSYLRVASFSRGEWKWDFGRVEFYSVGEPVLSSGSGSAEDAATVMTRFGMGLVPEPDLFPRPVAAL